MNEARAATLSLHSSSSFLVDFKRHPSSVNRSGNLAPDRSKSAVALLLTFVAGSVDVVGYIALYHVFTAHMTGTTVHLARYLVFGKWSEVAIAGSVICAFVFGSVVGRAVIEVGSRVRFRRVASITLSLEAAMLIAFIVIREGEIHAGHAISIATICCLLGTLACAMGLQTATLTRVGALTVHTTFVTGMLNKLAQLLSHVLFETHDWLRARGVQQQELRVQRRQTIKHAVFIFGIWLLYLTGAATGTFLNTWFGVRALYLPVGLLMLAIAVDRLRPLSIEEERDQSER